jgi:anti-sigma factor (TIGR02949 family)
MTTTPETPKANCTETLRELQTYLDGELPDDVRYVVDSHLLECTDCMQAFDFHAELKIVIATKCRTEAMPVGLLSKIESCFGIDATDLAPGDLEFDDPDLLG